MFINHEITTLLQHADKNSVLCLGENTEHIPTTFNGHIITNRYDIYQQLQQQHLSCSFSDFQCNGIADNSLSSAVFRIAKEKAQNIHIVASMLTKLRPNAPLHLIGYRNEGIESIEKLVMQHSNASIHKQKFKKQLQLLSIANASTLTLENDYATTRLLNIEPHTFFTKPGIFGWQKVDAGSQLLINALTQLPVNPENNVLDLGCGYGFLAIMAKTIGYQHIDASDNNAASIIATAKNFQHYHIKGNVFADNCANSKANNSYDLILCNPPFHQGFSHNKQLITQFCQSSYRLLKPAGKALFVVNQFIGLEKIAATLFNRQQTVLQKEGFKVIILEKS